MPALELGGLHMTRRSTEGSSTPKVRGRKTAKSKRKISTRTRRHQRPSVTDLREQLRRRTVELIEAHEQQAATAEVLRVISSSPGELKPVFESMLANAMRLCEAKSGVIYQVEAGAMRAMAEIGVPAALAEYRRHHLHTGGATTPVDLMRATKKPSHVHDARESDAYRMGNPNAIAGVELGGARTVLYIPMIKDDDIVGVINLYRQEVRPFRDEQILLLENCASQAVIAIENARLFEQTKDALGKLEVRSSELAESLQHQTATSQILSVISGSKADIQPVFDAIVDSAARLFEPCGATITTLKDGKLEWNASAATLPDFDINRAKAIYPIPFDPERSPSARALLERRIIEIPDIVAPDTPEFTRKAAAAGGFQSATFVPLIKQEKGIGTIILTHLRAGFRLSEKQLALVSTFADQAVIAIENARLFNETREALERQTATADILKVIASSPDDVQPVFQAIADRSKRLVNALSTTVFKLVDGMMHLRAFTPTNPEADATLRATFPAPLSTFSWGESIRRGEIYRVIDTEHEPEDLRDLARLRGWRSCLCVPLLRDGKPIGMIGPTRAEPGPFTDHHVQLLQTFADQAVIAISNVQLFKRLQERTRELSASLDDLRSAQDRLVKTEKLASLGQLTAGIAHEIKNPLNFVNNFSALSAELTDELNDVLGPAALNDKIRGEVSELTKMLKDNLEKVVQHGKRADSIVKNMLLHSLEGSGAHRPVEINTLLDESLNLAYHGARGEKPGFNIRLQRDFDPNAGTIELFPQEITRALLNLISNGFYAATKRKTENRGSDSNPVLRAATKNLGDSVEIRIRDNGTGIPAEVKEKMFNPFFTTKPAGEGTGLGLSMSHDIIVKQHGGTVDVETEVGRFTEFRITLPRTRNFSNKNRGQT
jgi:two-component system NtrC family sensor kinase